MTETRIAIIDDRPSWVEDMMGKIRHAARYTGIEPTFVPIHGESDDLVGDDSGRLGELLRELIGLRRDADGPRKHTKALNKADLVLVDFDLRELEMDEGLFTGELIAELIRHYTTAGPVVSVNRRPIQVFELAHRRAPSTNADFAFRLEDLDCRSLWGGSPRTYDPWHWPNLVGTAVNYRKRVGFVEENYNREVKIPEALGIPEETTALLPGEATRSPKDLRDITFAELADSLIPKKERDDISDEARYRTVASVVGTWLQSVVLPPQDILIDAPHLVRQFPSLVKGKPVKENLDKLARKETDAKLPLDTSVIEDHRFQLHFWLDRPAWWTSRLLREQRIKEVSKPWEKEGLRLQFAEDSSQFRLPGPLKDYESEGLFAYLYIEDRDEFGDIEYEPRRRRAS